MCLEKFCFCCKLHHGTIVCGVLYSVFSVIGLIGLTVIAISDPFTDGFNTIREDNINNQEIVNHINEAQSFFDENIFPAYYRTCIALISLLSVELISSVLLIIGALKKNRYLMLPWIIVNGLLLIPAALLCVIALIVLFPIYGPIYYWWCIYSTYEKIHEEVSIPYTDLYPLPASEYSSKRSKINA